jgi:hypothetical protein
MNQWQSGMDERAARARALSERVAALRSSARSRDGSVDVTVDSAGAIVDLRLEEPIRSAPDTAHAIMSVMREAQANLAPQVRRAAAEELGLDDPVTEAMVASYARRFSSPEDDTNG